MLSSFVRSGNLLDAVRVARDQASYLPATRADLAEIFYLVGDHDGAERLSATERVDSIPLDLQSRLATVHSCCLYERSEYSKAEEIARQALSLAEASHDSALSALAAAQVLG